MSYLPAGRVLAFAHRGGATHPDIDGLENTLVAFQHAWDLGYDYLETDVHVTKDGTLLAFHDDVLDRVSDGSGTVADLTLAEVRRVRIAGREPIPTFGELVEAFPQARFNIDIKSERAADALARFVAAHRLGDRVLVGSFSIKRIREFRRRTPALVPTAAHPWEIVAYRFSPTAAIAKRLTSRRCAALQLPVRQGRLRLVTAGLVRRAHANGVQVHVWTVDDPAEMGELLDLGVDGLFTDRTDVLKDVLTTRGQWWSPRGGDR